MCQQEVRLYNTEQQGLDLHKIVIKRGQGGQTLQHSYTRHLVAPEKLLLASRRSVSAVSGLSASRGPLAPSALRFRDATRPSAEQVTPSQLACAPPLLQAASPAQVSRGLCLLAGTCAVTGLSGYRLSACSACCLGVMNQLARQCTLNAHKAFSCRRASVSLGAALPPAALPPAQQWRLRGTCPGLASNPAALCSAYQ